MPVVIGGLAPHPPIVLPEIGGGESKKVSSTFAAMEDLARSFKQKEIDVLVTISPHGPVFSDAVNILALPSLQGSFAPFGFSQIKFQVPVEEELCRAIEAKAIERGFPAKKLGEEECRRNRIRAELDHGIMVPLYFLENAGVNVPLIPVNMGLLSFEELIEFGRILQEVFTDSPLKIGVIASGDLSHRLTPDAPAGYSPRGKEFDQKIMDIIEEGKLEKFKDLERNLIEKAGECGLRPLLILTGILENLDFSSRVLSYEGPFGVGYGVALFSSAEISPVELAGDAIENYLKNKELITPPEELPTYLLKKGGAFVTLKNEDGSLRGCIGTLESTQGDLAREIIRNAIQAATKDPRFPPISLDEFSKVRISVDVLHPPEEVDGIEALDHKKYGVIVEKGAQKGVLLPDIEGVNSAEEQLAIARMKAGLTETDGVKIKRFKVDRFIQR